MSLCSSFCQQYFWKHHLSGTVLGTEDRDHNRKTKQSKTSFSYLVYNLMGEERWYENNKRHSISDKWFEDK